MELKDKKQSFLITDQEQFLEALNAIKRMSLPKAEIFEKRLVKDHPAVFEDTIQGIEIREDYFRFVIDKYTESAPIPIAFGRGIFYI